MGYHSVLGPAPTAAQIATQDPIKLEISIFTRINNALRHCMAHPDTPATEFTATIQKNTDIWIFFAKEVAHPDHAYPVELRYRILKLAEFAIDHGMKVLSQNAEIDPLIDINSSMINGLAGVS